MWKKNLWVNDFEVNQKEGFFGSTAAFQLGAFKIPNHNRELFGFDQHISIELRKGVDNHRPRARASRLSARPPDSLLAGTFVIWI